MLLIFSKLTYDCDGEHETRSYQNPANNPEVLQYSRHPDPHFSHHPQDTFDTKDVHGEDNLEESHVEDSGGGVIVDDVEHEDTGGKAHW